MALLAPVFLSVLREHRKEYGARCGHTSAIDRFATRFAEEMRQHGATISVDSAAVSRKSGGANTWANISGTLEEIVDGTALAFDILLIEAADGGHVE